MTELLEKSTKVAAQQNMPCYIGPVLDLCY